MAQQEKIPADVCEELLYRLPSNDIRNFKRVCKDWNEMISSQRFVQKHLARCDGALIVILSRSEITVCGLNRTGEQQILRGISYPPRFALHNSEIVSSHNGLVCLLGVKRQVFAIINPSTGETSGGITHGLDSQSLRGYWFGRHPSTGEYLFVLVSRSSGMMQVSQFPSLKRYRSSQSVSFPTAVHYFSKTTPILLHGALHWAGASEILAYDIQENKLLEISTPSVTFDSFTLEVVDGYLCAILRTWTDKRFELWIMKEYGVGESWTKYCNIRGFQHCRNLFPRGFLPDGDLLLNIDNNWIVKYSFNDGAGTVLHVYQGDGEVYGDDSRVVLCIDSLASP